MPRKRGSLASAKAEDELPFSTYFCICDNQWSASSSPMEQSKSALAFHARPIRLHCKLVSCILYRVAFHGWVPPEIQNRIRDWCPGLKEGYGSDEPSNCLWRLNPQARRRESLPALFQRMSATNLKEPTWKRLTLWILPAGTAPRRKGLNTNLAKLARRGTAEAVCYPKLFASCSTPICMTAFAALCRSRGTVFLCGKVSMQSVGIDGGRNETGLEEFD
jgi:hypothetical protein